MFVHELKKPRKRPSWASPHMWEKMTGVVGITLFGMLYEFPVLPETLPFIALMKGEREPWKVLNNPRAEWKRRELGQDGMRFIIQALLQ